MSPVLETVFEIRLQMLLGVAIFPALEKILAGKSDEFSRSLKIWLKKRVAGQDTTKIFEQFPVLVNSPGRRALLRVLEQGLIGGSSIDKALQDLQEEFMQSMESKFERKLQVLPIKLLIPLTIFILPGVMALIIGPLFISLTMRM